GDGPLVLAALAVDLRRQAADGYAVDGGVGHRGAAVDQADDQQPGQGEQAARSVQGKRGYDHCTPPTRRTPPCAGSIKEGGRRGGSAVFLALSAGSLFGGGSLSGGGGASRGGGSLSAGPTS